MKKSSRTKLGFKRVCGRCEQTTFLSEWTFEQPIRNNSMIGRFPTLPG